ncbi:MAG: hypothetical protein PVF40_02075 [Ectothiorhodospiraceae bacterium]|jgi:hypothetical protein
MRRSSRLLAALAALLFAAATMAQSQAQTASEAYLEFHKALKTSYTMDSLWKYYTAAKQAEIKRKFPPSLRDKAFYLMKNASPRDVDVVKTTTKDNRAELTLRPSNPDERLTGTAVLMREADGWKVADVVWRQR